MENRRRYRKRADQFVVAVELDLETDGFSYWKWGAQQRCKRGDWLVDNGGDIYTVDREVFGSTYRNVGAGKYVKKTPVWAEVAAGAGSVLTKECESNYRKGDYLVYNNQDGSDAYCVNAAKFKSMYELDD
jgi:hypothetical protein